MQATIVIKKITIIENIIFSLEQQLFSIKKITIIENIIFSLEQQLFSIKKISSSKVPISHFPSQQKTSLNSHAKRRDKNVQIGKSV